MDKKERDKIIERFSSVGNSPLKHTERIFQSLLYKGYQEEVPLMNLKAEIKSHTGIVNDKKATQVIKTFCELGFIRSTGTGLFNILFWKEKEEIEAEAEAIAKEELKKFENMRDERE